MVSHESATTLCPITEVAVALNTSQPTMHMRRNHAVSAIPRSSDLAHAVHGKRLGMSHVGQHMHAYASAACGLPGRLCPVRNSHTPSAYDPFHSESSESSKGCGSVYPDLLDFTHTCMHAGHWVRCGHPCMGAHSACTRTPGPRRGAAVRPPNVVALQPPCIAHRGIAQLQHVPMRAA